ncbi:MAG: hypothetical protein FD120_2808, partial [Gammaproteobacteria bacterium]
NGFDRRFGQIDSFYGGLGVANPEVGGGAWDYRASFSVGIGGRSETFFINTDGSLEATRGGSLSLGSGTPSSFVCGTDSGVWTYTANDGTVVLIDTSMTHYVGGDSSSAAPGMCGVATRITLPDGVIIRINLRKDPANRNARIQSVSRNDGFQLKYRYAQNGAFPGASPPGAYIGFLMPEGVTGLNNAFVGCDPLGDTCSVTGAWPQSSYVWSSADTVFSVVDQAGTSTRFTMDRHHRVVAVKPADSTVDRINYQYCSRAWYFDPYDGSVVNPTAEEAAQFCSVQVTAIGSLPILELSITHDRVRQVVRDGQTWTYSFPSGNYGYYYLKYDSVDPKGQQGYALRTVLGTGALLVYGSQFGVANYENSARNRMISAQARGGPPETYTYDSRGNLVSDGITTAGFDATCVNIRTCNKPNWTRDPKLNQTDYVYDPTHGGVLSITGPAVNGVRPQTRYAYVQRYAWYLTGAGAMTRSTEPIWKLSSESYCISSAASGAGCAAANDQVVTSYDYGPDSGPNNLLLRGTVVTASGQSLRTCFGYDQYGNKVSETRPRAGATSCP